MQCRLEIKKESDQTLESVIVDNHKPGLKSILKNKHTHIAGTRVAKNAQNDNYKFQTSPNHFGVNFGCP